MPDEKVKGFFCIQNSCPTCAHLTTKLLKYGINKKILNAKNLWIAFDRFISRNARQDWFAKEETLRSWHYFKHNFLWY